MIIITPSIEGALEEINCFEDSIQGDLEFTFNPSPLDLAAPPGMSTITGTGFSAVYGMPLVQYYDMNGNLVDEMNATSVSSDGTTISAPTPDISSLLLGTYAGMVSNMGSDGNYVPMGTASVTVINSSAPPCKTDPCSPDPVNMVRRVQTKRFELKKGPPESGL